MPFYDFECSNCGNKMEFFALMHEREKQCPECKAMMTRLLAFGTCFNMPHKWGIDNSEGGNYDDLSPQDKINFRANHCGGDYFKKG